MGNKLLPPSSKQIFLEQNDDFEARRRASATAPTTLPPPMPHPASSTPVTPVSCLTPHMHDRRFSLPFNTANWFTPHGQPSVEPPNLGKYPAVFKYKGNANHVYVALELDGYNNMIPLNRSTGEFNTIINMPPGLHHYKFMVDGSWKINKEQPIEVTKDGAVNVVDIHPERSVIHAVREPGKSFAAPGSYGQIAPNPEDFVRLKEPPMLPAHLHRALLNAPPPEGDSSVLPVPNHVVLNHLYMTARTDGVVVCGMTQRYRDKFLTTVYYTKQHVAR